MNKIFQPFFTTKPTGQGKGLGLSLSYDIDKSHNSELNEQVTEASKPSGLSYSVGWARTGLTNESL